MIACFGSATGEGSERTGPPQAVSSPWRRSLVRRMMDGMDGELARDQAALVELDPKAGPRSTLERRDSWINASFTLRGHLLKVGATAGSILTIGVLLARDASWLQWAMLPVFWVVANVFEASIHRWPMHRPLFPKVLYQAHTLVHHFAYEGEGEAIEIRNSKDLNLVMMPWYTLLLVFVMASPILVAVTLIGGTPLLGIFLIAAVIYFLVYETIHTLHHLRQDDLDRAWWGRGRWLKALRAHHHHHHQFRHMRHTNFNVTFPLGDLLLGTYYRDRH